MVWPNPKGFSEGDEETELERLRIMKTYSWRPVLPALTWNNNDPRIERSELQKSLKETFGDRKLKTQKMKIHRTLLVPPSFQTSDRCDVIGKTETFGRKNRIHVCGINRRKACFL